MNCCNDFGTCESGLGCPCRRDDVKPAAVARVKASTPAPEVGNVWFAEPEPIEPSRGWEKARVWGHWLGLGLSSTALIFTGAGYLWQRWLA